MATSRGKRGKDQPTYPEQEVYTLSDLEQVRILADPLRVRILEALCQERTTKQVAEVLDEKPTKLYHHVEALERVGLVRLTRTRQNRGTLEKYFLAVARTFRTDTQLFAGVAADGPKTEVLQAVAATALDNTAAELRELITQGQVDLEAEGALCYAAIHTTREQARRIREKIETLLAEIVEEDHAGEMPAAGETERYRLTLAFFPLRKGER